MGQQRHRLRFLRRRGDRVWGTGPGAAMGGEPEAADGGSVASVPPCPPRGVATTRPPMVAAVVLERQPPDRRVRSCGRKGRHLRRFSSPPPPRRPGLGQRWVVRPLTVAPRPQPRHARLRGVAAARPPMVAAVVLERRPPDPEGPLLGTTATTSPEIPPPPRRPGLRQRRVVKPH